MKDGMALIPNGLSRPGRNVSIHTDRVASGGNRTRYQGGIYDCIWKKRIGTILPHQFEWYRDNNLCLLPSQTIYVWDGFFIAKKEDTRFKNKSDDLIFKSEICAEAHKFP